MAIPLNAVVWAETMDPYDVLDYTIDVSGLLESGEVVSAYSVTPLAESALLGLTVGGAGYPSTLTGNIIRVWLSIAPASQDSGMFAGAGATLPLEVSITTSSIPARKRQRTVVAKVAQR